MNAKSFENVANTFGIILWLNNVVSLTVNKRRLKKYTIHPTNIGIKFLSIFPILIRAIFNLFFNYY